ncbi:tRNA-dihydrouridine(20a/20b) synthase [NAD(P)+]-like [Haliotis rubra]|uniref:tRNA-dihydrouridine(20a/20b) synthase [NAD(P)+]-like n=1 Tax=Haliotis rubra TaxID=36100 RepID=UPI001EE538DD|nr:tRNA-dihydrouridine(20a/20b) synthase [NAD(P)+]-like [Haliotis rubra]
MERLRAEMSGVTLCCDSGSHAGLETEFTWKKPLELFSEKKVIKMCAPMVRYSKLPFRLLVRKYDCDIAFTPMIISDSFIQSQKARDSDFTTCKHDRPLIVQFAASKPKDFADAAEIVSPYADGVDLNCGCPQRWAMADGYGACLIKKPELMCDIVKEARARVPQEEFTVSVKIRIHKDIRDTVDLCQKVEKAGASFISVHGRTKHERCQPVHYDAIKVIKDSVSVPVVANGDIKSMDDVSDVCDKTGVDGELMSVPRQEWMVSTGVDGELMSVPRQEDGELMSVPRQEIELMSVPRQEWMTGVDGELMSVPRQERMLSRCLCQDRSGWCDQHNPPSPPAMCVNEWVDLGLSLGAPFSNFHHHLMYMLEPNLCRAERRYFNSLTSMSSVLDYLNTNYSIS